ncbi:hypothetical protein RB599_000254 [Gaeumannomyces hyphopodioides]
MAVSRHPRAGLPPCSTEFRRFQSGAELAKEVVEGLVLSGKHEVRGLTRDFSKELTDKFPSISFFATTYEDKQHLVGLLKGVDVLLCFFSPMNDAEGKNQMRLIDAAIEAGVKRYMPSEWFTGTGLAAAVAEFPYMASKLAVRKYLEDLNRDKKVIEYTLVSPGMFMDYLAYPHATDAKHTPAFETFINMQEARGFYMEGHGNDKFTLTAIHDIVNVVLHAIDYEGAWPVNGGVVGETVSFSELIELGQKLRGKQFAIDVLDPKDVEAGNLKITKLDQITHPSIPPEQLEFFTKAAFVASLRAIASGGMVVDGEWNRLLPDYKFMTVEELLRKYF